MATVVLCPTFGSGFQAFTAGGIPLNGGLLNSYLAGSSTPAATYTTSTGNTQHANPIQLNSDGRPPGGEVWLLQGQAYKFVLTDSTGANSLTWDNIPGINDAAALIGSITTAALPVIPVVLGGTGQTTTNAALDALHTTQASVTAAATLNLDAVSSSYIKVLGNTSIINVTLTDGRERTLLFNSTVAVSSNSTVSLIGGTTITALAGDTMIMRGEASGVVRSVVFQRGADIPNSTHATTFTFNGSGGSTGTITITYKKEGNFVTLHIPILSATTGTGSNALVSNTALPAAIRPATLTQVMPVNGILNNNAATSANGCMFITTGGILTISRDVASLAFTDGSAAGTTQGTTLTYFIG